MYNGPTTFHHYGYLHMQLGATTATELKSSLLKHSSSGGDSFLLLIAYSLVLRLSASVDRYSYVIYI